MKSEKRLRLEAELAAANRKILELKAQKVALIGIAFDQLPNASTCVMMGSGVLLQITALGGKEIIPPVMISDGLSLESVTALQNDLRDTFEKATLVNPAMSKYRGSEG